MHLWFLAVYVVVVSLTPIAIAAQRRWGLLVPGVLAVGVVVVDAATIAGHVPYLGWLNYVLCWGPLYQLGIAWHDGLLAGRRPALLAAGSAVALALLIWLGPYPVSMIGVPGQAVQNTTPPSVAMLAFACTQAGLAMAVAPALNRVLGHGLVQRVLSMANNNVMALYLWHMVPVVIVAIVAYPAGLLPQPVEGTGGVVAGSAGVGGNPQPCDSVRDGAVVVGTAFFRRTAPNARYPAHGALGRSRHAGRCRDGRLWPALLRLCRLRAGRALSVDDRANVRRRGDAGGATSQTGQPTVG